MTDGAFDFDKLVEQSTWVQNKTGEQNLWNAAFTLDWWFFVGHASAEDPEPIVGIYDGHPYLIAFTDEDRASEFARSRSRARGPSAAPQPVLHMEVTDAVTYGSMLIDQGVDGIVFNLGRFEFALGLTELLSRYQTYRSKSR